MSFLLNGKSFFIISSGVSFTRSNVEQAPMGFITNGGEFRDGPPPPPAPPPPSRYETFAQLDSQAGNPTSNFFSSPPTPPPPPTQGPNNNNYHCDVFAIVQTTVNYRQDTLLDPGLTVRGANIPGQVTIYDIDKATALNQQHREEHQRAHPDQSWQEPHMERRLVVDYIPDKLPASFERAYGQHIDGDPAHAQVFVTTAGSLSIDQLQKAVDQYQLLQEPQKIAEVSLENPSVVTRSIVARSTTGQVQYMVYRDSAEFKPK